MTSGRRIAALFTAADLGIERFESVNETMQFIDYGEFLFACAVDRAMMRTGNAESPSFAHLPMPVRFRATGALRAWTEVLDTLPGMGQARAALIDPAVPVEAARVHLMRALATSLFVDEDALREETRSSILSWLVRAAEMLCFWLRGGSLYEPSSSLNAFLERSDISGDMPMELLTLPAPALCIVLPNAESKQSAGGTGAATVFQQVETDGKRRRIEIALHAFSRDGKLIYLQMVIEGWKPDATIRATLEEAEQQNLRALDSGKDVCIDNPETLKAFFEVMRSTLDHIAKVLLYLKLDNAIVREDRPYSVAPKLFPGLGKRKRELKLAEIDRLYDRYIIGPEGLPEPVQAVSGDSPHIGHQVATHWRRGHFRSQLHGPLNSLRKVVFIAPVLVRADRLSAGM